MTKNHTFKALLKLTFLLAIFSLFLQCAEEEVIVPAKNQRRPVERSDSSATAVKTNCTECAFIVPADSMIIDGKILGLKPGSIIGLSSAIQYGTLIFRNIVGTPEQPIIIKNFGGTVNIKATNKWQAVKTEFSKYFRITGGSAPGEYGIKIQGGEMGLKMDQLSTNFEVDHLEVANVGFAGIMAKTDPTCNDATIRGNFTMHDVSLHDNFVHETGGEGLYIGNSFYDGMNRECGIRLPHEIKGLKVFNNVVERTGWEAIQVGCAIEGTEIYNNTIRNYGTRNVQYQNNGIQIGSGTGGLLYNNFVKSGPGNGLIIMGKGDNIIYNNIIVDAGTNGVFCDERFTPGEGFKFVNNTIISPNMDGIRLYADLVPMNTVVNNIIVDPGSYTSYTTGSRTSEDAFVYLVSSEVHVNMANNIFAKSLDEVNFVDPVADNFRLNANSPAVNAGSDISRFSIAFDYYHHQRLNGGAYDVGASEY